MTEWTLHIGPGGALALAGALVSLMSGFALLVRWAVRIELKVDTMWEERRAQQDDGK